MLERPRISRVHIVAHIRFARAMALFGLIYPTTSTALLAQRRLPGALICGCSYPPTDQQYPAVVPSHFVSVESQASVKICELDRKTLHSRF